MKVKIIAGTYGYRKNEILRPKAKGDVIDLDTAEAKRIIGLGIAVEAPAEPVRSVIPGDQSDQTGINTPDTKTGQDEAGNDEGMAMEEMSFKQLKAVAEQMGIENIGKLRSREALMDAIEKAGIGEDAALPEG